jgi:hypothetical protein
MYRRYSSSNVEIEPPTIRAGSRQHASNRTGRNRCHVSTSTKLRAHPVDFMPLRRDTSSAPTRGSFVTVTE